MEKRGFQVKSWDNYLHYFSETVITGPMYYPEHNERYLKQCFYNLQEKYDRGQKDFSTDRYESLFNFMEKETLII